ncbi:MAG: helix-turn-helix domain-containing protein [Actinobacteria bacterium]|nr:helix-turn-helix domain-containing protein [Actinomycetota bacterium]
MTQSEAIESTARRRLRSLRQARGWSLEELGRQANLSPSTISRLETGGRRLAIDHLVTLARALDTTVDELLVEDDGGDVVIRPRRDRTGGTTFWLLTRQGDPSDRVIVKMRLPERKRLPEPRTHPGRDWLYVLAGTVRLRLGSREILIPAGKAASFETMTPHSMGGHEGPAEVLNILDHHGERAHLHG